MIKGIIFELADTLLNFTGDSAALQHEGAAAVADWYLKKKRIKLDEPALVEAFLAAWAEDRAKAQETGLEVAAQQSLQQALQIIAAPATASAQIEAAVKVFFAPAEAAFQTYPDAIETLKQLKSQGYHLGLYTNAADDKFVQRLVNQGGLRPWLSPTFSSAAWGWRKPKAEPFALIAGRWGLSPADVAVVGNTLETDIRGAQQAGMPAVLIQRDGVSGQPVNGHSQPAAVITHLSALPEVIGQL